MLGFLVHCLDRLPEPDNDFQLIQERITPVSGGSLHYGHVDVTDSAHVKTVISAIAKQHSGINGLIAAAGIQQITPAIEYSVEDVRKMLDINYTGLFATATAVATQMMKYECNGSILLVGSMSGFIANKGLISPVYNSSKAAVIQLGRNLAMEWGKHGIRVNTLCPGHIVTPMVKKNFEDEPHLKKIWEDENMLGRLAKPEEFKGAGIFLLSNASSFMTGATLTIDGGHTAW